VERFRREIPDFPKPVKIRGRNYDYTREIQRWKRQRAAGGAQ
jgi:predicted DNA-binding transcriptional regulator AlpA